MLFNSFTFALFFLLVLCVAPLLKLRAANLFLLAASAVFYAAWDARFLSLMAFSTVFNYVTGARIAEAEGRRRRRWLWFNVGVNLAVLGFFKYSGFFIANLSSLLSAVGLHVSLPVIGVVLPLAISFYTFHCVSYVVDIYRGQLQPAQRLTDFALYLMLFPHLVAGPIVRASHLLPQIESERKITRDDWNSGLFLIFWGLFKKIVVADNLAPKADRLFALQHAGAGEVFLGTLAFAFQIYADFSGYTDMARGIARLLGFHFDLNFNFPYLAKDPSDFWRRWHISLSQWLRDYVFIPLGGSRAAEPRVCRNLMLTMLIGGLWHGAAWNFVLWGGYHGGLLCAHRLWTRKVRPLLGGKGPPARAGLAAVPAVLVMFVFTLYGWLLFRAANMQQIGSFTAALMTPAGLPDAAFWKDLARQASYILPMLALEAWMVWRGSVELVFQSTVWNSLLYVVLIYATLLLGAPGGDQFIYFNF